MSEQSLQDILNAEKAAAERIAQADKSAEAIRKSGSERAAKIDADTAGQIESERRAAADRLSADISAGQKAAVASAEKDIAAWREKSNQRSNDIIERICRIIRGETGS
jgi:vacuolar-type H+-ATPase subunit H